MFVAKGEWNKNAFFSNVMKMYLNLRNIKKFNYLNASIISKNFENPALRKLSKVQCS